MLPIREYLPGEEIRVRDPLNEREERKRGGMDQGDGYQTVSALGVGQKKIGMRFGITNAELFCMQWTGKTYTKDGTTKRFQKANGSFKVIFREWVITMKGVACAYRFIKGQVHWNVSGDGRRSGDRDSKGRVNRYAREKKHYKGMYLFEIAGDAKKA